MKNTYKIFASIGLILILFVAANWLVVFTAHNTMKNEAVQTLDWIFNEYGVIEQAAPSLRADYSKIILSKLVKIHSVGISSSDVYGNSKKAICKMSLDMELQTALNKDKWNEYLKNYLGDFWEEIKSSFKVDDSSCNFDLSSISRKKKTKA